MGFFSRKKSAQDTAALERVVTSPSGINMLLRTVRLEEASSYSKTTFNINEILNKAPKNYRENSLAYIHHATVKAAFDCIADSIADVTAGFYDVKPDGELSDKPTKNVLAQIFRYISPSSSPRDFMRETAHNLFEDGNAYWFFDLKSGHVHNLRPDRVWIATNKDGNVVGYAYKISNDHVATFDPEVVIHHKLYNPLDDHYGLSLLSGLAMTIESDFYARSWNRQFFKNSARPDVVLTIKGKLSDKLYDRLREAWRKKFSARRGNAHDIAVLEGDGDVKILNPTQKELDFISGLGLNREDILGGLRVPASVLGLPGANYATAREATATFWLSNIIPRVESIWDKFNSSDLAMAANVRAKIDLTSSRQIMTVLFYKMSSYTSVLERGVVTRNEIRKTVGLPPVEGGDVPLVMSNLIPADMLGMNFGGGQLQLSAGNAAVQTKAIEAAKEEPKRDPESERFEYRRKKWKRFDKEQRKQENEWLSIFKPEFIRQKKKAIAAIKAVDQKQFSALRTKSDDDDFEEFIDDIDDLLNEIFELQNEIDTFADLARDQIRSIISTTGQDGFDETGIGGTFDDSDKNVLDWIDNKRVTFATDVNETTRNQLKDALISAVDDGKTIQETADAVANVFAKVDTERAGRALTIARTETISANNAGQMFGYMQAGADKKEWVSSGDGDVRESHDTIDGEVVGIEDEFSNGLQFPGDPSGEAQEVINCRCTTAPVIEVE